MITTETPSEHVPGSFRDPSGYVFLRDRRVYRTVDAPCRLTLRRLEETGLLSDLIDEGSIVRTRFVTEEDAAELRSAHAGHEHFLEHEPVDPVSFPYEWSFTMLADAACLTLDLQMRLIGQGYSLKDATAYNIQFLRGRPVFIDLASIECPQRLDLWYALGQFSRMFTHPLLLSRYRGWDLRSYFLGHLDGQEPGQVLRNFGPFGRWHPRLLLDVTIPELLARREERRSAQPEKLLDKQNSDSRPQMLNLKRLRSKIRRLERGYKPSGHWVHYAQDCSYEHEAEQVKKQHLRRFLEACRPQCVLDLGCNAGDYSYIAAGAGAKVIAIDSDEGAIDLLYRKLRKEPADITPLVVDLTQPSPAIGFRNQEREPFLKRIQADCVLALALVHHLHVSGNLSIQAIRDQLWDLTANHAVVEFTPPEDEMFRRLTKFRHDSHAQFNLEQFRNALSERFQILSEEAIPRTKRRLLFLAK